MNTNQVKVLKSLKEGMALIAAVSIVVLVGVKELYPSGDNIAFFCKVTMVLGVSGFLLTPFASNYIVRYVSSKIKDSVKIMNTIKKLGIQKDGEYPKYLGKSFLGFQIAYYYSLPCGLSLADFLKHKDAFEQYMQHYIDIYYEKGQIVFAVSNEWMERVG